MTWFLLVGWGAVCFILGILFSELAIKGRH
jgi:hypothetical protein